MTDIEKARQACEWLEEIVINSGAIIVGESRIDAGNAARTMTYISEENRDFMRSLVAEFRRLELSSRVGSKPAPETTSIIDVAKPIKQPTKRKISKK